MSFRYNLRNLMLTMEAAQALNVDSFESKPIAPMYLRIIPTTMRSGCSSVDGQGWSASFGIAHSLGAVGSRQPARDGCHLLWRYPSFNLVEGRALKSPRRIPEMRRLERQRKADEVAPAKPPLRQTSRTEHQRFVLRRPSVARRAGDA